MAITPMYKITQVATGVAGSPYYITGYFDTAGGTAQQAAQAWRNCIIETAGAWSTPLRYDSILTADRVDPVTGDKVGTDIVNVGSVQFTSVDNQLPPSNTLVLGWRTGVYVGGREVRGRTNLSGFLAADSVGGVPDSSTLTTFQGKINLLLGDTNSELVVWSRKAGQHYPVTAGYVGTKWGILRSRRD